LEIHLAVFLFGLAGLFGKLVALPATIIVFGRVAFGSLALFAFLKAQKTNIALHSSKDYGLFVLLGIVLAVHWTTFYESIQVSTVAIGLISFSTFPMFVTFLEPLLFKEKVKLRDLFLAVVTVFGATLVVPTFGLGNNVTQGVLWGLVSAATFALLSVLNRKAVKRYSSQIVALFQDFVATLVLLPFLFIVRPSFSIKDILLLIFLGVVLTAISHSLYINGMKHIKAHTASIIASLEPVYGIVFALALFHEVPSMMTVIGGVIILGAALYSSLTNSSFSSE